MERAVVILAHVVLVVGFFAFYLVCPQAASVVGCCSAFTGALFVVIFYWVGRTY